MNLRASSTRQYIRTALKNDNLRQAVNKATQTALQKRLAIVEQTPNWEDLRLRAHSIKQNVIEHLDEYLERFEKKCGENGIHVHWATDAEEARTIIKKIVRQNNVASIVKSKSLTTEEIHLNPFLTNLGVETLETDLGEYIVQLLDQTPSHLTAPALHLTRQDVGRIFQQKLGVDYTENPHELLQIARKKLRQKFLQADMGISGVNFAIASSGAFVVIENEANARLSMGLPRIHLAVMGIEKLIPTFQDLPLFLKLLPPSATGQKQTVYVNIIGGAQYDVLGEGPEQVHIVLLDNGRSKIAADVELRETLFCIRCGACLNVCPIYQQVGGHAYGWIYMGPIGATLIPQFLGLHEGRFAPFLSSLCGACHEICPMRIRIPHHLLKLRNQVVEAGFSKKGEKSVFKLWAFLAQHPVLYRLTTWLPGKIQIIYRRPFPAPGYWRKRALGLFDSRGFRRRFLDEQKQRKRRANIDQQHGMTT
ncbi:MAG: iron-sulfur cluster-binding protein [Calditrichaeota bacterium]|nr:MAG: iron-sulfur cluster-binding protein [Calditrichota bacterium]